MFAIFMYAANAILPIILLIALGYILRRVGFLSESFLTGGNRMVFRVMLPMMIFTNIYEVSGLGAIRWNIVGYGVGMVLVLFGLGLVTVLTVVKKKSCRGVILQCVFRSNYAIIGIPLVAALGSAEATQLTAVMIAFTIPTFNALAVIALSVFGADDAPKRSVGQVISTIVKNPLILSAGAGLAALAIRATLPLNEAGEPVFSLQRDLSFVYTVLKDGAKATTFVSLVVLGGLMDFSAVKGKVGYIALGTVWRVVLAPAIGLGGALLLSHLGILPCTAAEYTCFIALFGAPVAVSSAIMAVEMGGDGELARQLVLWTSVSNIVTMFVIVMLFRSSGLI